MSNLQINAAELNLKTVFTGMMYMIPVYQRPYSWDIELCEQLWDDLTEFMRDREKSDAYFLGTIIVTSEEENPLDEDLKLSGNAFSVIDGQQRLTTLSILMRALYKQDSNNADLKSCLYNIDSRNADNILSTRIISNVNNNTEALHFMSLFDETLYTEKLNKNLLFENDKYKNNYKFFEDKVLYLNLDDTHKLVDIVLSKVTLLKVSVPKREDALIIFKTINDRGKDLDEADILKAEIFNKANQKNEGKDFIEYWDSIFKRVLDLKKNADYNTLKDFNMPTLFRTYMYIKRGVNGDITKEIKILDFFKGKIYNVKDKEEKNNLANMEWKDIMADLDRICGAIEYVINKQNKISFLYKIISYYPNSYPHYVSILYLFHRIKKTDTDNSWHVEKKYEANCEAFLEQLLAFVYTILILSPGVNYLKEVAHRIMVHISDVSNNDIKYKNLTYSKKDFENFENKLNDNISNKIIRGYLMLLVYLNPETKDYKSILKSKKIDVEHILPKKWHDNWYDEWNEDKFDNAINKIGNLIILDRERNIKASNSWFGRKKEIYKEADFSTGEIIDLINILTNTWSEKQFIERQNKSVRTLMSFFKDRNK